MIEKFISGEETIRLRNADPGQQPDNVGMRLEQNIFSIDSLSLVIGQNGSGKTRLLDAMWDAMDATHEITRWNLWQPVFHYGAAFDSDNVGVIFFSHAPNRRKRKAKFPHKCIDASPSFRRNYPPESILGQEWLLKGLIKQDSRFVAEFRANLQLILSRVIQLMLAGQLHPPRAWHDAEQALTDLSHLYQQTVQMALRRPTSLQGNSIPNVTGRDGELDDALNLMCVDLFQDIKDRDDFPTALSYLIVAHSYLDDLSPDQGDELLIWLFCAHFGFQPARRHVNMVFPIHEEFNARRLKVTELLEPALAAGRATYNYRQLKFTVDLDGVDDLNRLRNSFLDKLMTVGWSNVSSGQWALVTQLMEIEKAFKSLANKKMIQSILVLIDEGDAFLHLEWQREYIGILDRMLSEMKRRSGGKITYVQAVIATHSPLLASDVPRTYVNRLDDGRVVGDAAAFAAAYQSLLNGSFGAKSIGAHATSVIRKTVENVSVGEVSERDHYVASIVDDPIIRRELTDMLDTQGRGRG